MLSDSITEDNQVIFNNKFESDMNIPADQSSADRELYLHRLLQQSFSLTHDSEYYVNLDADYYHTFKLGKAMQGIAMDGKFSDLLSAFINLFESQSRQNSDPSAALYALEMKRRLDPEWMRSHLQVGSVMEFDYHRWFEDDKKDKWFRLSLSAIGKNKDNKVNEIIAFTTETTQIMAERKALENELSNLSEKLDESSANLKREMSMLRSFRNIYEQSFYISTKNNTIEPIILSKDLESLKINYPCTTESLVDIIIDKIDPEYRKYISEFLDVHTLTGRMKDRNVISCEFKDINENWFRTNLILVDRHPDGSVDHAILAVRNISIEKHTEENYKAALIESAKNAEKANMAKTQFLSQMSHDIRTPLNAIIGFATLMQCSVGDPSSIINYTEKILRSGNQLLLLINEVLDMSKIESGHVELDDSKFNMSELISSILDIITPNLTRHGTIFKYNIDSSVDEYFSGDSARISQFLVNLLDNAIKYSSENGHVELSLRQSDMNNDAYTQVEFTISDNGCGMSEEFQQKLFTPFSREERTGSSNIPGTGLGLTITKNLVELMGGTIHVKSRPDEGTVFTISIPLKKEKDDSKTTFDAAKSIKSGGGMFGNRVQSPTDKAVDTRENLLDGKTVLIAEDNELNAEIVSTMVELNNARTVIATNGADALKFFDDEAPGTFDLILMDIQMPVMNGLDAARAIRKLADTKGRQDAANIPIIALTANAFDSDVQNALDAGMDAHVPKPININALNNKINEILLYRQSH